MKGRRTCGLRIGVSGKFMGEDAVDAPCTGQMYRAGVGIPTVSADACPLSAVPEAVRAAMTCEIDRHLFPFHF